MTRVRRLLRRTLTGLAYAAATTDNLPALAVAALQPRREEGRPNPPVRRANVALAAVDATKATFAPQPAPPSRPAAEPRPKVPGPPAATGSVERAARLAAAYVLNFGRR